MTQKSQAVPSVQRPGFQRGARGQSKHFPLLPQSPPCLSLEAVGPSSETWSSQYRAAQGEPNSLTAGALISTTPPPAASQLRRLWWGLLIITPELVSSGNKA